MDNSAEFMDLCKYHNPWKLWGWSLKSPWKVLEFDLALPVWTLLSPHPLYLFFFFSLIHYLFFSFILFLAHLSYAQDELLWSLFVLLPSLRPLTFSRLLLWSPRANFAQISYGASLGWGERKIAKMVAVHWPRWPPCPYMVKTFKNLLLQNRGCLGAESLHKSSGMGGLPKLLK